MAENQPSRFADMSQYEKQQSPAAAQAEKQREFNRFVVEITDTCFQDCVTDFTKYGDFNQGRFMSQEEVKCFTNCSSATIRMHTDLPVVMEQLNQKYMGM